MFLTYEPCLADYYARCRIPEPSRPNLVDRNGTVIQNWPVTKHGGGPAKQHSCL